MAYDTMNIINEAHSQGFEYSVKVSGAVNGDWVLLPVGINFFSVTVVVTAGTAKVQSCVDEQQVVKEGTPVAITDWSNGVVGTGVSAATCYQNTALRIVGLDAATEQLQAL